MKVEIFRRTVKDRRRGNSYELLYHLKEGIEAAGDQAILSMKTEQALRSKVK